MGDVLRYSIHSTYRDASMMIRNAICQCRFIPDPDVARQRRDMGVPRVFRSCSACLSVFPVVFHLFCCVLRVSYTRMIRHGLIDKLLAIEYTIIAVAKLSGEHDDRARDAFAPAGSRAR